MKIYSNDPLILDALGDVLIQNGDHPLAKSTLMVSISLDPEGSPSKYLNLAQLLEGQQSLKNYQKALQLLGRDKALAKTEEESTSVRDRMVSCLSAMAEIYLTDECFAENAESECNRLLLEALQLNPQHTEALQLMASFKISQQNKPEAIQYLLKSRTTWSENVAELPTYEFRVQTAKLFLELEQWEPAAEVLDGLLEELDSNSEIWYLAGFANLTLDAEYSKECLEKCTLLLKKENCNDQGIWTQVNDCMSKVHGYIEQQAKEDNMEV
uniref:Uncharacterized protein n=1 Tax=Arcella intermedia TaxID=1963864 RepID=A0A6B2LBX4_9EUKA